MDFLSPNIAYADFDSFMSNVNSQIINPLIEVMFAVALLFFLYGVFKLISNPDSEEVKTEAKSHMLWGVIGFVIMLGVWGILNIIISTLGLSDVKIDDKNNTGSVDVKFSPYNGSGVNKVGP